MNIIFESNDFIFVNKEPLVLTVPPRMKDSRPILGIILQNKLKTQIYPVHRLDYEVSGLVCFAKNEKAHRQSQLWFEEQQVVKFYEARTALQNFDHWPSNVPNPRETLNISKGDQFHWQSKILRGKKRSFFSPQGDIAITEAIVEQKSPASVVWVLNPITGKPHQLRLELSYRGYPINGDILYGSKMKSINGIELNSYKLDFKKIKLEQRFNLPDVIEIKRKFV